jgi:hypothetical protein
MSDSLHNLARSRERTRMVRRADGDEPEALSDSDSLRVRELAYHMMARLAIWVIDWKFADSFAVRGAVLRQMTADYDREREAMEAQDAAAESDR